MNDLSGKRALVTGAATGIGRDIAMELARREAQIAVHYANGDRDAYETAQAIKDLGCEPALVRSDLRTVFECNRTVEEAAEALGGLDVLVNNAELRHPRSFLDTDEEAFDEVFDPNVKDCIFCTNRAVPFMLQAGGGSIVNVVCMHGQGESPGYAAHAAAAGAIIAFTRELALELRGEGIRVNAVGPSLVKAPPYIDFPGCTVEFGNDPVSAGRMGFSRYVARGVAFLASDAAGFVTGQLL